MAKVKQPPQSPNAPPSHAPHTHMPTDNSREIVQRLVGLGFTQEQAAAALGISETTLKKYYKVEMKDASVRLHGALANNAVTMALAGDKTMLCFVLKTRFGWREKERADEVTPESEEEKAVRLFNRLRAMEATVVGTLNPTVVST